MPDRIPKVLLTNNTITSFITELEVQATKIKTTFWHIQSIPILPTLLSKEKTIQSNNSTKSWAVGWISVTSLQPAVGAACARSLMMIRSLIMILFNDHCCSPAQAHPWVPHPGHGSHLSLPLLQNFGCPIWGIFIPVYPGRKQWGKYNYFAPPLVQNSLSKVHLSGTHNKTASPEKSQRPHWFWFGEVGAACLLFVDV